MMKGEEERPPKRARKRGRCGECKREKDLKNKVRTHCGHCDSFACSLIIILRCAQHRAVQNLARRIKGLSQRFF